MKIRTLNWGIRAKFIVPTTTVLLLVFALSGWVMSHRFTQVLQTNEDVQLDNMQQMLHEVYATQLTYMATVMKMTVVQQALYDGYFGAQTDDFDFLKEFLVQSKTLAQVDDALVVQEDGHVMLRAATDQRGDAVPFTDILVPILQQGSIADRNTELDGAIKTSLIQDSDGFKLITVGPVMDVETIVATLVFVKNLDARFLVDSKRFFDEKLQLWIASADDIKAATLAGWELPHQLTTQEDAFNLTIAERPYRFRYLALQDGEAFLGLASDVSDNMAARKTLIYIGAVVMSMALALIIGALMLSARVIIQSIGMAVGIADNVAKGMLNNDITISSKDEMGQLLKALAKMQNDLRQLVTQLQQSADEVKNAAQELVNGNADLSQRTQEQASSLEETAASMEQMTATIKQNADNAHQANQLAVNAHERAGQGGRVVHETVQAMGQINQASSQIAEIIGVIDEIAFQTNLLALNASVEAARAGEQGRGFAVVADEVRNLAQRSAQAAKEIKELIQDSVSKVKAGSELVDRSGQTLEQIVTEVKKVGDIVAEIVAASQEQSAGIEQVNRAVTQMDQVTQQNAALAEQTSAASEAMSKQSRNMQELLGFFTLVGQADGRQ